MTSFIIIIWNTELVNTQNRTSPCLQVHGSSQTFVSRCSSRIDDQQLRVAAQAIQQTLAEAAICSPTDAEAAWSEGNIAAEADAKGFCQWEQGYNMV